MNMQTKPPLTVAEQALVEDFSARIGDLPGNGAVTARRDRLVSALRAEGLPTRRIEAWHYTDLRALLRSVPDHDAAAFAKIAAALVPGSTILSVINGTAHAAPTPDGLTVQRLQDRLIDGTAADLIGERDRADAIGRINGAFLSDGFAVTIEAGARLERPIETQVLNGGGQAHTRFTVMAEAGCQATIVERHEAVADSAALVSSITDLEMKDGAEITYVLIQKQGGGDTHLGQMNIRLGENARLRLFILNAGGKLVRQEVHAVTVGAGADLTFRAVNLLGGDSHCDVTLTLGHDVPETTSTEIVRNVVFDRARGVFQGQIRVAQHAQKTDARMACNTLLLSDEADFSTKPELEIFADDVQCAHGATVADIDENHLFYLMSRGISEKSARALLVNAFVASVVEELEDEPLIEALEAIITTWLERHA